MTFNVLHASIVTQSSHCSHEALQEIVHDHDKSISCDDFCDMHHFFHLSAIIVASTDIFNITFISLKPNAKNLGFHPPFYESINKPPIA
jgi:hypothetical protein